jgi:hypothetical protein
VFQILSHYPPPPYGYCYEFSVHKNHHHEESDGVGRTVERLMMKLPQRSPPSIEFEVNVADEENSVQ